MDWQGAISLRFKFSEKLMTVPAIRHMKLRGVVGDEHCSIVHSYDIRAQQWSLLQPPQEALAAGASTVDVAMADAARCIPARLFEGNCSSVSR